MAVIRAGAAPGMHLVGFDAPGESLEMRLTARDRSAYASGAVTAAEWLLAEPRTPGFHPFDDVVDSMIIAARAEPGGGANQAATANQPGEANQAGGANQAAAAAALR